MATGDSQRRATFAAVLGAEAVSASTAYVLVDLDGGGTFPHRSVDSNWLNVLGLTLTSEKASDGIFDIWVGVVTATTATVGTAEWFQVFHLEAVGNSTDSTDRFAWQIDYTNGGGTPDGINCKVTSGALEYTACTQSQADNANWQNDTNRTSPAGNVMPAVGDLVVWVEEVTNGGTLDFSLLCQYEAH